MSYSFNPFTGNFDIAPTTFQWTAPVANTAALPLTGNKSGDVRVALDTGALYEWNGSIWQPVAGNIPLTDGHILVGNSFNLAADVALSGDASITDTGALTVVSVGGSTSSSIHSTVNIVAAAASANTPSTLVLRDGSGNFSAGTITASLTGHSSLDLALTGGTMSGQINMGTQKIVSLADPTSPQDAATKNYADSTFIPLADIGAANGVAPLDSSSKIPAAYLPSVVMQYEGAWNPNTNTPTLVDGTGTNGFVYYVSAAKSGAVTGLTDPSMINFQIGDLVIYSSSVGKYQLTTPAAGVSSVNGAQGAVTVNAINQLSGDIVAGPVSGSSSAVATIQSNVVDNSKLAQMATLTIKGNNTGGTTDPLDLTVAQVSTMLGLSGFANTSLSNLTSPTSVNQVLRPAADNAFGFGTNVRAWSNLFTYLITAGGGGAASSIDMLDSYIFDPSNVKAIDWKNRDFYDTVGTLQIQLQGGIKVNALTASTVPYIDASNKLVSSAVTPTELGFLSGVTSSIQTQLNGKVSAGTAILANGTVPFTASQSLGSFQLNNVADPTSPQDAATKTYVDAHSSIKSPGDISETSFAVVDNQSSPTSITGFAFANGVVRSFKAQVSLIRGTTYSAHEILGIQRGSDWVIYETKVADDTGIILSITTAGQVQYTTTSTGSGGTLKFRASTTSV